MNFMDVILFSWPPVALGCKTATAFLHGHADEIGTHIEFLKKKMYMPSV